MMTKNGLMITQTTVDKKEMALVLSRKIIENKIGVCVQIHEIESVYEWEGEINTDKEFLLVIKHFPEKIDLVVSFLEKNHPYEVPEIISFNLDRVNDSYLKWAKKN